MRDVGHEVSDAEDHLSRVRVLVSLTVDLEPQIEVLRIGDLIGRYQPRPDGSKSVETLPLVPGTSALELRTAAGDVIDDGVASDMLESAIDADILPGFADDH